MAKIITPQDAAKERDRVRQLENERAEKERGMSTKDREAEVAERNVLRKQEKEAASSVLKSGSANVQLSEIAKQGGALGRKLEREIRRFAETGRVSRWLAGETIKAEAAQNAAQQGAFREQVTDVISTIGAPVSISSNLPSIGFGDKPIIQDEGGGAATPPHPWKISLRTTESDVVQFKVELNSRLYSGLGSWANIEVDGLDGWTNAGEGYIILFGVVEDGVCTEASIQGPQETLSDRIDFVSDEQSSFAFQLGYLFQDENDNFLLRQNAFHNLTLMQTCIDGKAALYPFAT